MKYLLFFNLFLFLNSCNTIRFYSECFDQKYTSYYMLKNRLHGLMIEIDSSQHFKIETIYNLNRKISSNKFINDTLIQSVLYNNSDTIIKNFNKYSGGLENEIIYMNGKTTTKTYFNNVKSISSRCGKVECGCFETFYSSGQIKSKYCYMNYAQEDTLTLKGKYTSDISATLYYKPLNGRYFYWYENGKYKRIESWNNFNRDGKWIYYSEKGEIIMQEIYKDGILLETIDSDTD